MFCASSDRNPSYQQLLPTCSSLDRNCASDKLVPPRPFYSGRGEIAEEISRLRIAFFASNTDLSGQT
jgi:hypothetical protein